MNGCIIPNTPIAVDFWKLRNCPSARVFFLTHLHGDHITGLTSSWTYPIHCSEITGKLLVSKHGIRPELVRTLQVDCPQVVFLDADCREQMTVTAIDANHCPGAVMFLFQGYFGTILHTGDFRFSSTMISPGSMLSGVVGQVDVLYLDNTYCSPSCVFPPRDDCIQSIIDLISARPDHDVVIGMRNLGKEELLCRVATHFRDWVSVPSKLYSTLELLGAQELFKDNASDCRIKVVPFHSITSTYVTRLNEQHPTVGILPTALYCGIEALPFQNQNNVFVVPYSDHSSYKELFRFVSFVQPRKITPIVKSTARGPFGVSIADRADMSCFDKYLLTKSTGSKEMQIPGSVSAFMKNCPAVSLTNIKRGRKRKLRGTKTGLNKVAKRGVVYDSPKGKERDGENSRMEESLKSNSVNESELKSNEIKVNSETEKTCTTNDKLIERMLTKHADVEEVMPYADSASVSYPLIHLQNMFPEIYTTAPFLASQGFEVSASDTDSSKQSQLNTVSDKSIEDILVSHGFHVTGESLESQEFSVSDFIETDNCDKDSDSDLGALLDGESEVLCVKKKSVVDTERNIPEITDHASKETGRKNVETHDSRDINRTEEARFAPANTQHRQGYACFYVDKHSDISNERHESMLNANKEGCIYNRSCLIQISDLVQINVDNYEEVISNNIVENNETSEESLSFRTNVVSSHNNKQVCKVNNAPIAKSPLGDDWISKPVNFRKKGQQKKKYFLCIGADGRQLADEEEEMEADDSKVVNGTALQNDVILISNDKTNTDLQTEKSKSFDDQEESAHFIEERERAKSTNIPSSASNNPEESDDDFGDEQDKRGEKDVDSNGDCYISLESHGSTHTREDLLIFKYLSVSPKEVSNIEGIHIEPMKGVAGIVKTVNKLTNAEDKPDSQGTACYDSCLDKGNEEKDMAMELNAFTEVFHRELEHNVQYANETLGALSEVTTTSNVLHVDAQSISMRRKKLYLILKNINL